jgi:hypothetical protein
MASWSTLSMAGWQSFPLIDNSIVSGTAYGGGADDRRDALAAVRTDRRAFWQVSIDAPQWIELRGQYHHEDLGGLYPAHQPSGIPGAP